MTTTLPARADVDPSYTWNTESVFPSVADWSAELAVLTAKLPDLRQWQGQLAEGPGVLAEALDMLHSYAQRLMKAYMYAMMDETVDTGNQQATARVSQVGGLFGQFMGTVAFVEPEVLAIGREQLAEWQQQEPQLDVYGHYFDDLYRRQAHVRSPEVEEVLGMAADAFMGASTTHTKLADSDFQFAPATSAGGQEVEVSQGTLDDILNSADREARRTAWQSYHDQYLAYKNTLASNYATSIKQNVLEMRVRRYPSTLEMALFENNIPVDVFHNLLATFERNAPLWQRYWRVRRKALGVETLHTYDVWAPLTAEKTHVPYEQAVEWIAEALRPLGDEYAATIRRGGLEQRWVDVYPNRGKTSGAFSAGTQGTYPFILMSYTNDPGSLGTLAHEFGHSMHSYLTWQHQPPVYADYSLFAAEVASNFHQAMLRGYLLKQDIGRELKIGIIEEAMANFHRYFLEMPTLAKFEWEMHKRVEQGEGLTADEMIDYLADRFAIAYGDEMQLDRQRDGIRWATFSHLYADYYVYAYATGISGANALARRVLSGEAGAADAYLGFLKAGGSQYPLDALKAAGADLSTPEPVEAAFAVLGELIDQLEELTTG